MAIKRLQSEYKNILKDPYYFYNIEIDTTNILCWNIILIGPQETIFEGGLFKCQLIFPPNYPNKPPSFKFLSIFPHPNIYADGKICISILNEGVDEYNYELLSERWKPTLNVHSILISILSLLSNPNLESPANVDASKIWQNDFNTYKNIIYNFISKSQN
jgi:ubiquitin-conjugating enzyme E2 G1